MDAEDECIVSLSSRLLDPSPPPRVLRYATRTAQPTFIVDTATPPPSSAPSQAIHKHASRCNTGNAFDVSICSQSIALTAISGAPRHERRTTTPSPAPLLLLGAYNTKALATMPTTGAKLYGLASCTSGITRRDDQKSKNTDTPFHPSAHHFFFATPSGRILLCSSIAVPTARPPTAPTFQTAHHPRLPRLFHRLMVRLYAVRNERRASFEQRVSICPDGGQGGLEGEQSPRWGSDQGRRQVVGRWESVGQWQRQLDAGQSGYQLSSKGRQG